MKHKYANRLRARSRTTRGMALVITLALIVLLTISVMAFFARATSNRVIENSRTQKVQVDQMALTASDYIVGRFLQEITDSSSSTATTAGRTTVYQPKAITNAVPMRLISSNIPLSNTNYYTLIRQSVPQADTSASAQNTSSISANGRSVSLRRWNAPVLMSGGGFLNADQLPNWIYMNADGATVAVPNTKPVGRFAYNVYDIGSLLDVNVAGHPSSLTATQVSKLKNTLAGADLTLLGVSTTDNDALVSFRNPGWSSDSENPSYYGKMVMANSRQGFLTATSTDKNSPQIFQNNFFNSRQDLLRYARTQNPGLTNALPYLTHFSRNPNSPSWGPQTGTSQINYSANATAPASTNRFLPSVRVVNSFLRADGTQAIVGEPLVKARFPLSRLGGLGANGVLSTEKTTLNSGVSVPATTQTVRRDFGLVWDNTDPTDPFWNYAGHPNTTSTAVATIKTLNQVAAENREPDFFELLKASILTGAVGEVGGDPIAKFLEQNADLQILQIGANIIDQFDGDSFPTRIKLKSSKATDPLDFGLIATGVEDLPYISSIVPWGYRPTLAEGNNAARDTVNFYIGFSVWRLHQAESYSTNGPTKFRVIIQRGKFRFVATNLNEGAVFVSLSATEMDFGASANQNPIEFSLPDGVLGRNPLNLTNLNSTALGGNVFGENADIHHAMLVGSILAPDKYTQGQDASVTSDYTHLALAPDLVDPPVIEMQYLSTSSNWITYNKIPYLLSIWNMDNYNPSIPLGPAFTKPVIGFVALTMDPRTSRFGLTQSPYSVAGRVDSNQVWYDGKATLWPDRNASPYSVYAYATRILPSASLFPAGELVINQALDPNGYYPSADGITRPGDGYMGARPMDMSSSAERPIILNRPFQSVAELGFAFRDTPWKNLSFWNETSADAGLLDVFSIDELETKTNVSAGKVNILNPHSPVIASILSGAGVIGIAGNYSSPSTLASSGAIDEIASSIVNQLRLPLVANGKTMPDASDLVTRLSVPPGLSSWIAKAPRETVIRALGDVVSTRTWTFLIDVVAQTGRFRNASTASGDFIVEAESRRWVSISIDRVTGEIVDQRSEEVNE